MGLKNKIKGFIKERMPFVVRYVRSLKGAKNIYVFMMKSIMKLRKC